MHVCMYACMRVEEYLGEYTFVEIHTHTQIYIYIKKPCLSAVAALDLRCSLLKEIRVWAQFQGARPWFRAFSKAMGIALGTAGFFQREPPKKQGKIIIQRTALNKPGRHWSHIPSSHWLG